jgi:hypothetical protein
MTEPVTTTDSAKKPKAKAEEPPPVHAAARDITPTGAAVAREPQESPSNVEAREMRERFSHIVRALEVEGHGMGHLGARLFAAHIIADKGTEAAATMDVKAVSDYASRFRERYPFIWGPVAMGDVVGFSQRLKAAKLRPDVADGDAEGLGAMLREYQSTAAKLATPIKSFGSR